MLACCDESTFLPTDQIHYVIEVPTHSGELWARRIVSVERASASLLLRKANSAN